jgi:hypothetical protein
MRGWFTAGLVALGCSGGDGKDTGASEIDFSSCEIGDASDTLDNEGQCSREWVCSDVNLYVACSESGSGYACTCTEGDAEVGQFELPAGECLGGIHDQDLDAACGWAL